MDCPYFIEISLNRLMAEVVGKASQNENRI